jgi:hypothetical protein
MLDSAFGGPRCKTYDILGDGLNSGAVGFNVDLPSTCGDPPFAVLAWPLA